MDNVSKALIIAGAILIALALLSMSVFIYNSANTKITSSQQKMSATEIELRNSKFEQYVGTKVRGSEVKGLISAITVNNAQNSETVIGFSTGSIDSINDIVDTSTYTVKATQYTDGVLSEMYIIKN